MHSGAAGGAGAAAGGGGGGGARAADKERVEARVAAQGVSVTALCSDAEAAVRAAEEQLKQSRKRLMDAAQHLDVAVDKFQAHMDVQRKYKEYAQQVRRMCSGEHERATIDALEVLMNYYGEEWKKVAACGVFQRLCTASHHKHHKSPLEETPWNPADEHAAVEEAKFLPKIIDALTECSIDVRYVCLRRTFDGTDATDMWRTIQALEEYLRALELWLSTHRETRHESPIDESASDEADVRIAERAVAWIKGWIAPLCNRRKEVMAAKREPDSKRRRPN